MREQCVFDLGDLDAMAADLDLPVLAADADDAAVGAAVAQVAGPVAAQAGVVRIDGKRRGASLSSRFQ